MSVSNLTIVPFEGFCNVIAIKLGKPFGTIRRYVDILFVILSLAIIIIFKMPNTTVREGTIIYTFVFGPLTNIFIKSIKELKLKIYKKCIN
jgi:uncharacterized membrane protein YczE